MTLFIDLDIPKGALAPVDDQDYSAAFEKFDTLWMSAETPFFSSVSGGELAWHSRTGRLSAVPTEANEAGVPLARDGDIEALGFRKAEHLGMVVNDAATKSDCFSFAVIFRSPVASAKTLVCLNSSDLENYIFLSEADGAFTLKDQNNNAEVSARADQAAPGYTLAVGAYQSGRLFLQLNGKSTVQSSASDLEFFGGADLFIGCRSHRAGIKKTLGESYLAEVFFWDGVNCFADDQSTSRRTLIETYWRNVFCNDI